MQVANANSLQNCGRKSSWVRILPHLQENENFCSKIFIIQKIIVILQQISKMGSWSSGRRQDSAKVFGETHTLVRIQYCPQKNEYYSIMGVYTVSGSGTHCKCVSLGFGVFDSLNSHKQASLSQYIGDCCWAVHLGHRRESTQLKANSLKTMFVSRRASRL